MAPTAPTAPTTVSGFGPDVIGEEAFAAEEEIRETGASVFGPDVIGERAFGPDVTGEATPDISPAAGPSPGIPDIVGALNVEAGKAMVAEQTDIAVLDAMHAAERRHPKYEKGRKGVLDAIEERKGEIVTAEANV